MPSPKRMVKRSEIEVAKRLRTCKFSRKDIRKGERCLVVHDAPRSRSTYSREVGLEMIRLAREQLDEFEEQLKASAVN